MTFDTGGAANIGRRYCAVLVCIAILLTSLASKASATCRVSAEEFTQVPMRVGVGVAKASAEFDEALNSEIALLNQGQELYVLDRFQLADGDSSSLFWANRKFDVIVAFDEDFMDGAVPKYNGILFTYRNTDLSQNTMFIDFRFNAHNEVAFAFIQIKPSRAPIDKLLLEVALAALSAPSYMQDPEFRTYYAAIDKEIDAPPSAERQDALMAMRERVILGCLLKS